MTISVLASRWALATLVGGAAGCAVAPSPRAAEGAAAPDRVVPDTLTWESYDAIKRHVALRPRELTYQSVPWRHSVVEGLKDAQTQDKPLLLWLYFGGPRGAC